MVLFIMLKLSKKTEYAFMAARYLALNNSGHCSTAKEIAENYDISRELVAKVLQNFARNDIAASFQGVKGGYVLKKDPEEVSLYDIILSVEDKHHLTNCMDADNSDERCSHEDGCKIKDPLIEIQKRIDNLFVETSLKQIL